MFVYAGKGVGKRWQYMFTKWRLLCRDRRKNCQGEFSFLSLPLWSKYTFEDLTNEQEMCSRKLEWKEMGFKVLKVTMSPRYIWMTRNRMHKTNYSKWMLYGLGKKVSCPPSTVLHFEFSKNTWRTYDLKLNALLIFCNSLGSCSENVTWQRRSMKLSSSSPLAGT